MTREIIEGMREIILPFVKKKLLEINYENLGKSDAEEFKKHFNEILDLAIKALEQEPRKGHWDIKDNMWWVCSACGCKTRMMKKYNVPNFCPACGADMREVEE